MSELLNRANKIAIEEKKADIAAQRQIEKMQREAEEREHLGYEHITEFVQILRDHNTQPTPLYAPTPYYGGLEVGQTTKLCHVDYGWIVEEHDKSGVWIRDSDLTCNTFSINEEGVATANKEGVRIGWDESAPELCDIEPDTEWSHFASDDSMDDLARALTHYGIA